VDEGSVREIVRGTLGAVLVNMSIPDVDSAELLPQLAKQNRHPAEAVHVRALLDVVTQILELA